MINFGGKMNNDQLKGLNEVIKSAIDHGGDVGGPYFSYPKTLKFAIEKYLTSLDGEYEIDWKENNYPTIRRKNENFL